MIIAIDFDGTIVQNKFPAIGQLMHEAKEYMNRLAADGHYIIIWTCRSGDDIVKVVNFLLQEGIRFDRINENNPDNMAKYTNNSRKVYAHAYVDDRNVGGFLGWEMTYKLIGKVEKEYQEKKKADEAS